MPYKWQKQSESEGSQAAKIPPGKHYARISKILYADKDGNELLSQSGDSKIRLIWQDNQARERMQNITLSEKAAWVLAKILGCCDPPANLAHMEQQGVEPFHFSSPEFGDKVLLDRRCWIVIDGKPDDKYPEIIPVKPEASPATAPPPPPATSQSAPPPPPPVVPPVTHPKVTNQQEAWAAVLISWEGNTDPNAQQRCAEAWIAAVQKSGKDQSQMTAEDWQRVVDLCSVPF